MGGKTPPERSSTADSRRLQHDRSRRTIIILMWTLVVLTAWAIYGWTQSRERDKRAMLLPDVFEAVYREIFNHVFLKGMDPPVRYLRLLDEDPWPEFLRRFEGEMPRVRAQPNWIDNPIDPLGPMFIIEDYKWVNAGTIQVHAVMVYPTHGTVLTLYTLERQDGKWAVTKEDYQGDVQM